MSTFELIAPDREDIELVPALASPAPALVLADAQSLFAQCSFGDMRFYHFQGEGYSIWQSCYDIHRPARVIGRTADPVLELTTMYENSFSIDWQGVVTGKLPAKQIELYYAPYVENCTQFRPGSYLTLDVHLQVSLLEPYAPDFPVLDAFLQKVAKGEAAKLFKGPHLASPRINAVLQSILQYGYLDSLAPKYYDAYVNILLILLLERLSGFRPGARILSAPQLELAQEAKRLLTMDYEASLTIAQLCRKLGTNPYLLKTVFKGAFGISIGKYKKASFMDHAKQLLLDTDTSLDHISIQLGYNSPQSFSTAYKNHFGHPPGLVRRRNR
jgi:AraC-like DNA-binding protein